MDHAEQLKYLADNIKMWASDLGFQKAGISSTDVAEESELFQSWLSQGYQGEMHWLDQNKHLRFHPEQLQAGAVRVISVRMNYLPQDDAAIDTLKDSSKAYIARYALGRDYHKVMRKRLAKLVKKIESHCQQHDMSDSLSQRAFVDSAPVLERSFADKAGLGWTGKHTLLLEKSAGSWFFLGEILTNLPLPVNESPTPKACGDCTACLKVCPTDAFPKPYVLDARRCISYLTIENKGAIPLEFRQVMGNRVFGCDDCQIICPWNKDPETSNELDFRARNDFDDIELVKLFSWDEATFLTRTAGTAIRRVGYHGWVRNLAIGLGNADGSTEVLEALTHKRIDLPEWVQEHIDWAIREQTKKLRSGKNYRLRKLKR